MRKKQYWVLIEDEMKPEIFDSQPEFERRKHGASRAIDRSFYTKEEAMAFADGSWEGLPLSGEAAAWLEEYKAKEGQLIQETAPGAADALKPYREQYPNYCVYVDGSYGTPASGKAYGFGLVFLYDGKIELFYGGGNDKKLLQKRNATGELLACMEAIKRAVALGLPELTIVYDSQLIRWAYHRCGQDMLTQAVGRYFYEVRDTIKINVKSIRGRAHGAAPDPADPRALADHCANSLADKLAKKGAGIV